MMVFAAPGCVYFSAACGHVQEFLYKKLATRPNSWFMRQLTGRRMRDDRGDSQSDPFPTPFQFEFLRVVGLWSHTDGDKWLASPGLPACVTESLEMAEWTPGDPLDLPFRLCMSPDAAKAEADIVEKKWRLGLQTDPDFLDKYYAAMNAAAPPVNKTEDSNPVRTIGGFWHGRRMYEGFMHDRQRLGLEPKEPEPVPATRAKSAGPASRVVAIKEPEPAPVPKEADTAAVPAPEPTPATEKHPDLADLIRAYTLGDNREGFAGNPEAVLIKGRTLLLQDMKKIGSISAGRITMAAELTPERMDMFVRLAKAPLQYSTSQYCMCFPGYCVVVLVRGAPEGKESDRYVVLEYY